MDAFVIMPIKQAGTPDYLHFRALYDDVIRPVLRDAGFVSTRADDVQKTGAVTADIISRLARADLVIADLTDLNPNVFYELGARHALRGSGTIMMIDQSRTESLPFDVMPYRAILYSSDVAGVAKMKGDLRSLSSAVVDRPLEHRDSPVHDAVPILPVDAVASAAGDTDRATADELSALRSLARDYESRFGPIRSSSSNDPATPLDIITSSLAKARRGELLGDLLRQADDAAKNRDPRTFLEHVSKLLTQQSSEVLLASQFIQLAGGASNMNLEAVANAIYEEGVARHPTDENLRASYRSALAHSPDPRDRERPRSELLIACGLRHTPDGELVLPESVERKAYNRIGIMLDAYHADQLHRQALSITTELVQRIPDSTVMLRCHARALREEGSAGTEEVDECYRRSVRCPDVDSTSAQWLGTYLFNNQRYIDAVEAYLLACKLNPDSTRAFSDLLHAAGVARRRHLTESSVETRPWPEAIDASFFESILLAAFSCAGINPERRDQLLEHAQRAEVEAPVIEQALSQENAAAKQYGFQGRFELAQRYFEDLRSSLTQGDASPPESQSPRKNTAGEPGKRATPNQHRAGGPAPA